MNRKHSLVFLLALLATIVYVYHKRGPGASKPDLLSLKQWYRQLPSLDVLSVPRSSMSKRIRVIEDYKLLELLGAGGYGSVRIAAPRGNLTEKCVVKKVRKAKITKDRWICKGSAKIPVEAAILVYLGQIQPPSPHVISLREYLEDKHNYYLIFELLENALSIAQFIKGSHQNPCRYNRCKEIVHGVAMGISFLHSNRVVHGDIKDENILVHGNFQNLVKLIDFGSSDYYIPNKPMTEYRGGSLYKSPQVMANLPYDGLKQDIWALGVLLYYMAYRKFPLPKTYSPKSFVIVYPQSRFVNSRIVSLIKSLLCVEEQDRPSIEAVLKHPYFEC